MKDSDNYYFDLISLIWEKKFTVIISTISFSLLAVLLSFSQNILFESKAILKARDSNETNSQGFGALGGLSNLVGVDIATEDNKRLNYSLAVLKSRDFFELFYKDEKFLVNLHAVNGFEEDYSSKINPSVYDSEKKIWKKTFRNGENYPGFEESYEYFHERVLRVQLDKKTNFFHFSVETPNPKLSKSLLEKIIIELNNYVRQIELNESKNSVNYLEEYLSQNTNSIELRESVSKLLENEIKTQMYANIQAEYLLEQIEKPRMISEKSNPKRSIWLIFGFVLGLIVSFGMIIYGKVISRPKP